MRKRLLGAGLLALAGCGGEADPVAGGGAQTATKAEAACNLDGLQPALRETLVVIDRTAVKAAAPETFRTENPSLWALVTGLVDPVRASETGAMAPRERLTIALADPRSGGLEQIFTGCVPIVSKEEFAARAARGEDGRGSRFMGSDLASQLEQQQAAFQNQAVEALATAKNYGGAAVRGDGFETSGFARAMKTIGPGRGATNSLRRVFLYADPASAMGDVPAEHKAARERGFAVAETVQANLGMSELYVVPAGRPLTDVQRAFLDAVALGARADLRSAAAFSADALARAPVRVVNYSGELPLTGSIKSPMDLRLATAADGTLVNSWLSYTGTRGVRATPVSGQFACASDDACTLQGDPNMSLGQRWRTEPGTSPQALPDGPLGGLRLIEGKDDGQKLVGRIHDPVIFVNESGDIPLLARRVEQ